MKVATPWPGQRRRDLVYGAALAGYFVVLLYAFFVSMGSFLTV